MSESAHDSRNRWSRRVVRKKLLRDLRERWKEECEREARSFVPSPVQRLSLGQLRARLRDLFDGYEAFGITHGLGNPCGVSAVADSSDPKRIEVTVEFQLGRSET